jgi:hypothetical protein
MSENTRLAPAIKLSESTGVRRAVPGAAPGRRPANTHAAVFLIYVFDFTDLYLFVRLFDFFKNVAFCSVPAP